MNQKGTTEFIPNVFVKVLLILMILLALFWGLNGVSIAIFFATLTQIFPNVMVARVMDGIVGLATTLTAILLLIRILKRD